MDLRSIHSRIKKRDYNTCSFETLAEDRRRDHIISECSYCTMVVSLRFTIIEILVADLSRQNPNPNPNPKLADRIDMCINRKTETRSSQVQRDYWHNKLLTIVALYVASLLDGSGIWSQVAAACG